MRSSMRAQEARVPQVPHMLAKLARALSAESAQAEEVQAEEEARSGAGMILKRMHQPRARSPVEPGAQSQAPLVAAPSSRRDKG